MDRFLVSTIITLHKISDVHPSEPVIRTATAKIFDKSNFLPPKNSLLSIKSEKDIQNLNVKELKVSTIFCEAPHKKI